MDERLQKKNKIYYIVYEPLGMFGITVSRWLVQLKILPVHIHLLGHDRTTTTSTVMISRTVAILQYIEYILKCKIK